MQCTLHEFAFNCIVEFVVHQRHLHVSITSPQALDLDQAKMKQFFFLQEWETTQNGCKMRCAQG